MITPDYDPSEMDDEDATMSDEDPFYWPADARYDHKFGCLDVGSLPTIARDLQIVGFSDQEITVIMGGNFRRIAEQVWK